jgi:uncharacterized membrane protein YraQ (UPF0718 family)/copper chaperone CopZ
MELIIDIIVASWAVLTEMAPYLLLGFFVAGVLSVFISPEWVERHLGGRGLAQVFKASVFGVPLPLCSCGVLPVGASLRRQGASRGATTAFMLSTPQTGVDSIAVTYGLLGPFIAVVRPVAALVTGVVGGTAVHAVAEGDSEVVRTSGSEGSACGIEGCCDDEEGHRHGFLDALHYGFVVLPRDIGKALLVGVLLSGVISALIAPDTLKTYLGGGLVPMLAAMAIGIPLYVCATASTPIAASLITAGLSPGAALVFLITGPATNTAAVTTLLKVLGRKSTIIYLATVSLGDLVWGLLVDGLISSGAVPLASVVHTAAGAAAGHEHHATGGIGWWIGRVSAVVLLLVTARALLWRPSGSAGADEGASEVTVEEIKLDVRGMNCTHCVQSVTRALAGCDGVEKVDVQLEDGSARVAGEGMAADQLVEAVNSLGFEAKVA